MKTNLLTSKHASNRSLTTTRLRAICNSARTIVARTITLLLLYLFGLGGVQNLDAAKRTIFLKADGGWSDASAKFGIHVWGGDAQHEQMMTQITSNLYYATIPDNETDVIFVRLRNDATSFDWNKEWNRLQTTLTASNNYYTIGGFDYGTWSSSTISIKGSPNSWGDALVTLTDIGDGTYQGDMSGFTAINSLEEYRANDSKGNWYGSSNISVGMTAGATYDIAFTLTLSTNNLTAIPTQKTFSVTASSADNNKGTVSPASAWVGSDAVTFTATPNTGYHWTSWGSTGGANPSNAATSNVTATADGTITANFAENTFTVTATKGTGGASTTVTTSPAGQITGTAISATPSSGYTFSHWEITSGAGAFGSTTTANTTFKPTANSVINAVFSSTAVYYTWAYGVHTTGGGTLNSTVVAGNNVQGGTSITLTASPSTGYEIEGWYSDASCTSKISAAGTNPQYTFSINANTVVYVKFKKSTYNITYTAQSTGWTYGGANPTTGQYGDSKTLTITPATGYSISVTSADATLTDNHNNTYSFTMPAKAVAISVSATEKTVTLTPTVNDANMGTVSDAGSVGIATSLQLNANKNAGYKFDHWTLSSNLIIQGEATTTDEQITVKTNGDGLAVTAQAVFVEDLTSTWFLAGNGIFGGWATSGTPMTKKSGASTTNIVYSSIIVAQEQVGTKIDFKAYTTAGADDNHRYYAYSEKEFTRSSNSTKVYTNNGAQNMKFCPDKTGTYEFQLDCTGSEPVLTVTFPSETKYTVTLSADTNGTVSPTSVEASDITKPEINATADPGYYFSSWNGTTGITFDNASAATTHVAATQAGTATATFLPTWSVRGSFNEWAEGNYIENIAENIGYIDITLDAGNHTFKIFAYGEQNAYGNTGTITRDNCSDYVMNNTKGDCTIQADMAGTYRFTFNITTHTLSVTYPVEQTYTVNISANEHGAVSPSGDQSVPAISGLPVTATPDAGYKFNGWNLSDGVTTTSSDASTTIHATQAGTATAAFLQRYVLRGSQTASGDPLGGMPGWDVTTNDSYTVSDSIATITATLAAATQYKFKIYDNSTSTYYGQTGSGEMPKSTPWTLNGNKDVLFTTNIEGTYTFNINFTKPIPSVSITFPTGTMFDIHYPATPHDHYTLSNERPLQGEYGQTVTFSATPEEQYFLTVTAKDAANNNIPVTDNHNNTFSFTMPASAVTVSIVSERGKCIYLRKEGITQYWSGDVWVYFYKSSYWDASKGAGSNTNTCTSGPKKMTRIGNTDMFYYSYANDTYQRSSYVAFNDHAQSNYDNFVSCQAIYRGDFDERTPMFVVKDWKYWYNTTACYYNDGYWMTYNDSVPGYTLNIYNVRTGGSPIHTLTLKGNVGATTFKAAASLIQSTTYYYELMRNDNVHIFKNNGTMTVANHENWNFEENKDRCGLTTTTSGSYTFTLSCTDGKLMMSVDYPLSVNDYRLVYYERDSYDAIHNLHAEHFIKHSAEDKQDTISFYINKKKNDYNKFIRLQYCSAVSPEGVPTWTDLTGAGQSIAVASLPTDSAVCNFVLIQTTESNPTIEYIGEYEGNYYIRTDCAGGGWKSFTEKSNLITQSDILKANMKGKGDYDYYFTKWILKGINVRYIIANDYADCVSDTLKDDATLGDGIEALPADANVRFMWNSSTNAMKRVYIGGSAIAADRFLVLASNGCVTDKNGNPFSITGLSPNEAVLIDKNNWVYMLDVQASEKSRVKLSAQYNGQTQYFKGAEGDFSDENTEEIIGGSNTANKHVLRVIYNFKTDHLISAWLAGGDSISGTHPIYTDVMVIREAQGDAAQITFKGDGALSEVKTAYGTMLFNKWTLNAKSKYAGHADTTLTEYERALYWISFPFDVQLNDVFGFGTYGTHWIIEYYDGAGRAENGFWVDSDPNWKYVLDRKDYILEANKGYVLGLDLSQLTESSDVWANGVDEAYLYFPSAKPVSNINATLPTNVEIPAHTCTIERDNRKVWDSNWNLIGVPSYANMSKGLDDSEIPTTDSIGFYYAWNPKDNCLSVQNARDTCFKSMFSYLVQFAGTINWKDASLSTPKSVAARHNEENTDITIRLALSALGTEQDRTFVRLQDNATEAFDMNLDLTKTTMGGQSTIYTINDNVNLAANCLPMSSSEVIIPVGVSAKDKAIYNFSVPKTSQVEILLEDIDAKTTTNLSLSDYEVQLESGSYQQRFRLHIRPSSIVTDMSENLNETRPSDNTRKILLNGQLLIQQNGNWFNAQGQRQ